MDAAGPSFTATEDVNVEEEPNIQAKKFYEMLKAAEEPLYNGCTNHTQLSRLTGMLSIKFDFNIPHEYFDAIAKLV